MATMNTDGLLEIKKWVMENNTHNPHMKFFLDIRDDILVSVRVVFFSVKRRLSDDIKKEIYGKITLLSHHRLHPVPDDSIHYGVLKIDANYIHRRCTPNNIITAFNYIRNTMPDVIKGGK